MVPADQSKLNHFNILSHSSIDEFFDALNHSTNGVHIADSIRRVDAPASGFEFEFECSLGDRQNRYLNINRGRSWSMVAIEFLEGSDSSASIVTAVTIEPSSKN